jgi:Ni/Fe-hydrogenase b-type cytochrome subunit
LGSITAARLMALAAAAAPPGSEDPVDVALSAAANAMSEPQEPPQVTVEDFEPAVPSRRVSVTRLSGWPLPDGAPGRELAVLRGELRSVMSAARLGPDQRLVLKKNAAVFDRRGFRPLGVASAPVGPDGSSGPIEVHGFVPVRTVRAKGSRTDAAGRPEDWVRVPVWPATLRWLHWLNLAAIVALTMTGFYIANPTFMSASPTNTSTGFFMGYARLVHYAVAWAWITIGAIRLYLLFFSRDRYVRWPTLWPLKSTRDVRNMGRTLSAYLLVHPDSAPTYVAHNPLQQISYSAVYLMALLQVITGLALYGLYNVHSGFWRWFEIPVNWLGAPDVRLIHYLIMLVFWVFVVLHVYLVIRADTIDRDGGLSSMVNGAVWLRRGSHPIDDPSLS